MPNHVTHKILFAPEKAKEVFAAVCPDGKFDFETLVPCPLHVYQGGLGREEDEDFPINWNTWSLENWGTKWNCYSQSSGIEDGRAFIKFDTAWSIPYPILAAFANKFNIPFEHRYFDEGHNYWGIETWGNDHYDTPSTPVHRITKRKSSSDDKQALCIELRGYDPEAEDSEVA
jgi:hypothetical protein